MDGDDDVVAVAGQGLVDGVVDDLEDHVVQAGAVGGVADVHAGPLAHGLQAFELLDAVFVVVVGGRRCLLEWGRLDLPAWCFLRSWVVFHGNDWVESARHRRLSAAWAIGADRMRSDAHRHDDVLEPVVAGQLTRALESRR